jgi:hypothetical protein
MLSEGRAKQDRGDRMGAVMLYEKALKRVRLLDMRAAQTLDLLLAHPWHTCQHH